MGAGIRNQHQTHPGINPGTIFDSRGYQRNQISGLDIQPQFFKNQILPGYYM